MRRCSIVRLFGCLIASLALSLTANAADKVQVRVSVTSQPSGATVVVDGKDRGTTPITLFDLKPGRHHLKYRLAGYCERDRFFSTDEGPFIEKNEVLVEEKGLLLVKTDPPGADIQVDGVSVGRSPRLITHLAAKDTYSVRLRKAGYQDQKISVKFEGRKPLVREETLVPASGTIDISSEPSGAEVTVNGISRGKTPLTVTEIPRGRAVVKFKLEGFEEEVRELAVNAGDRQALPVALKGLPGTMHLVSVPDGARFYLNDEARGKGPLAITGLKPGEYKVRAELEGYGTVTRTVTLGNGTSAREEFRLSSAMGRIEVRTSPVGAQVLFDGRPVGLTKSSSPDADVSDVLAIESVLEGEHTLVVRRDGYEEAVRHPKVESTKTLPCNVRLKRVFVPDVEIETARGTCRGMFVTRTPELWTVEVSLGITKSIPVGEIRKVNWLKKDK